MAGPFDFLNDEDLYGPLSQAEAIPDFMLQGEGNAGPSLGGMVPDFYLRGSPAEEDAQLAALLPTAQQEIPNDLWSRLALSGAQFQPPNLSHAHGAEAVAGGLAALLSGFAQSKTGQARNKIAQIQSENQKASENARALALYRHQREQQRRTLEAQRQRVVLSAALKPQAAPQLSPEERAYQTTKGAARAKNELGPTPTERRAEDNATRAADAAERANRLATMSTLNQLVDNYQADKGVQPYLFLRSNLDRAKAAAEQRNGLGDVTLIFAYGRAREPENPNVLREGEFSVASKAAGQFQSLKSLPKRFFQGDRLTDEGRRTVLSALQSMADTAQPVFEMANEQYRRQAALGGIDPSLFIRTFSDSSGTKPTPGARRVR